MFENMYTTYDSPYTSKGSQRMQIAAMILGIISIASCTCLYLAIPCGALAVILGVLSRGGQMKFENKAQIGIFLGLIGLGFTIVLFTSSFLYSLREYGSIEGILRAYAEMNGMDYEEMMQQLYPESY